MGPTWGRRSEEWTLHFGFALDDKDRFDESKLTPRLRELLKLPELDLKVLHVSHWILERVVADKYWNNSRIFIAGDAAHRRPPTSGLGLNTAIQDAHNIAWKLAFVLNGKADPSLMETYEIERRPIGIQNSDWALFTFTNFGMLNAAFGLMPGQPERNAARFAAIFEDSMMGSSERAQIQACIELQKVEFSSHGIEVGFHYPDNGAIAPDGTEAPPRDPRGMEYIPSTRPGHRLPHAWIGKDHQIFSTHDLTGGPDYPDFVLITDEAGDAWIKEAKRAAQSLKLEIGIARIQSRPFVHEGPDYYEDREGLWTKVRGFKTGGAILVRPDKMVAWRSQAAAAATGESRDDLSASLLRILRKAQPSSTTNGVSNGAH
jgi:2,4-dichlorophenol 6-monooxygenase